MPCPPVRVSITTASDLGPICQEGHSGEEKQHGGFLDAKISLGWVPVSVMVSSDAEAFPSLLKCAEQRLNSQRPRPKTVLGDAGSHWTIQGTLLSSHTAIQQYYLQVQECPSRFYSQL